MPLDLTALEAAIAEDESVDSSATTLINALLDEVEANKNDPARIQALVDRARASSAPLAAAVARGTAAENPPAEPGA